MGNLLIVGAGPVGTAAARAAIEDQAVDRVVGVVDPDPAARHELEVLTGAPGYASTADLPTGAAGDRAIVAFSSNAEKVAPAIDRLASAGYHAVTTCEGLAWPDRHIWKAMHAAARSNGRVIIVTGANPGFIMDKFPLLAATASRGVTSITVNRRVNSADRRLSLVEKTGRGLTPEEFAAGLSAGRLAKQGLVGSIKLLAHGLKWPSHDIKESIEPIIVDGLVTGLDHHVRLRSAGRTIELNLTLDWDLEDCYDEIHIEGDPPLHIRLDGGYHGDRGTTTQLVSALRHCTELEPAFYRPIDLPLRIG